jgi:hypothetical protein
MNTTGGRAAGGVPPDPVKPVGNVRLSLADQVATSLPDPVWQVAQLYPSSLWSIVKAIGAVSGPGCAVKTSSASSIGALNW